MVHKFMDVECGEMPEGLEAKLRNMELFTYRDTVLKEHLFSVDAVRERMEEDPGAFTYAEFKMLNHIASILDKKGCAYFRFVAN